MHKFPQPPTFSPGPHTGRDSRNHLTPRTLTQAQVDADDSLLWNTFVDLIATESPEDFSPVQLPAHLVFRYEHEVQNGGHAQFFENQSPGFVAITVDALQTLNAPLHKQILQVAIDVSTSPDQAAKLFTLDRAFGLCTPTLPTCLDHYLKSHQDAFITLT